MINKLFSSQITFDILSVLFDNRTELLSTSEIIKLTDKNQANVQRELDKLIKLNIVFKKQKNRQNFYSLNNDYRFFKSLQGIFLERDEQKQKYFLLNEESGVCFLSLDYMLIAYVSDYGVRKGIIKKVSDAIAVYRGNYGQFYFEKDIIEQGAEDSLKKLLKNPTFVFKIIYPESIAVGEEAKKIFQELYQNNFQISKNKALRLFDKFLEIISIQIGLNTIAIFDLKDQLFSNYLKKYLVNKIKPTKLNLGYVMERLLAPEKLTYTQILRLELLELALKSQNSPCLQELKDIYSRWRWLNYGYVGPGFELGYFQQIFKELRAKNRTELEKEKNSLLNNEKEVQASKQEIYRQLKIDLRHQNFINALGLLSYLKIHRKDTAFLIFYLMYQIFAKLAPDYKKEDLFNLTREESKDLLRGRLTVSRQELQERSNYCVYPYQDKKFLYGAAADKYLQKNIEPEKAIQDGQNLKLLEGTAACLGKTGNWIYGEVKIINSTADMNKMREGDVLISVATTPDILAAMKKAAAIVTDHGGITCHAAIVSRELNIPCLIATKYATKIFKDGDKVIVCPRHNYIKFQ
ncbi:MAG: PEP-utilizing enzyme [Candidatus Falkowbacteria bacterium]|nr:PEP-utilizing enzyme [Candidatus Falkowbacteria bacterium]